MSEQLDDEISFLDMAVFLAEHWVIIFLIPAIFAVAAFFVADQFERGYLASATISLPDTSGRDRTSPIPGMVSEITYRAGLLDEGDVSVNVVRNTVTVSAGGQSREAAGTAVQSAIDTLTASATRSIEAHANRMEALGGVLERLDAADPGEMSADTIATMADLRNQVEVGTTDLEFAKEVIAQAESAEITFSRDGLPPLNYALFVLIAAGFLGVIVGIVRNAFKPENLTDAEKQKVNRVRAAFRMRPI